jgi:hypothetical protein
MATLAFMVALPSIGSVIAFDRVIGRTDTRVLAANWLDSRTGPTEWACETPAAFLHPLWGRSPGLHLGRFDSARKIFVSDKDEAVTATWIAIARSPLSIYTTMPEGLMPIVQSQYSLAARFPATNAAEASAAFDQQDMFFVPYTDFTARERPGPEIEIYRRRPEQ